MKCVVETLSRVPVARVAGAATQFGDGAGSGSGILPWAPNGEEDEIEKRED